MRKVLGCCISLIIFVFSFLTLPSPIFAANNQCPIFTINGKDARSGSVQIDTNTTAIEVKIGGQLKPGDTYSLYIDGIQPGSNKKNATNAKVDDKFLLTFSIDKTKRTINGNKIFPQPMDKIFDAKAHSVAIYTPAGFSGTDEICSFPKAYTITPVAIENNANCDIHFGIPDNPDHLPIYKPGEPISIYGELPTYDKNKVSLQILDPTRKEILVQCTDFNTTNDTFSFDLPGQTGQEGYWLLNIYRANVNNFGIKTFCSRASDLTFCPSVSFQVTTQTPLPTSAPGEIKIIPTSPLPPCSQWAGLNKDGKYVPIPKDRIGEYFKNGQLKPNQNVKCIAINTAIGEISTEPQGFVKRIFSFVLGIAGGIALILIIIAGYRLMASAGNPEALTASRDQLISAIVGLLFIIFSFVILQVIGVDILKIPGFNP